MFKRQRARPADGQDQQIAAVAKSDAADHGNIFSNSEPNPRQIPRKLQNAPNTYMFRLAPVRTKLGDQWEQYSPSVHRIATRVIFRSLDGKGSFQRFGDTYVLSFDRLRGKRAQLEGERLYSQFIDLLSKGKGGDDSSGRRSRNLGAGDDEPTGRSSVLSRMFRRLKSFFTRNSTDAATGPGDEKSNESETAGQIENREEVSAPVRGRRHFAPGPSAGRNSAGRPATAKRFKAPGGDPDVLDAGWTSPRQKNNSLENLKLMREAREIEDAIALTVLRRHAEWSAEMANRDFPPSDLSFIYRSMWNLRSKHLTTYTSVPICWKTDMEVYHGEAVVPLPRRPQKLFDFDMLCLEDTVEVLNRLVKGKLPVLFMNVVHASTLADKDRLNEFLAAAEAIPQAACRQLIFEIVDIGEYAHTAEAIRMVKNLLPFGRAVTASVGLQDRNFAFWKHCGFMAVGADISRDRRTEEEIIGNLAHFSSQAKRNKLLCYLRELDKFSLTISATAAGFDFLEGAVIGSGDDPENLTLSKFDIEDLYDDDPEVVWAS